MGEGQEAVHTLPGIAQGCYRNLKGTARSRWREAVADGQSLPISGGAGNRSGLGLVSDHTLHTHEGSYKKRTARCRWSEAVADAGSEAGSPGKAPFEAMKQPQGVRDSFIQG